MTNIVHADYQDSSIPFVLTTRADFQLRHQVLTAYNFGNVLCLNLSQSANAVDKHAQSQLDFLARSTVTMAQDNSSLNSPNSYYTTGTLQRGGKPARIVPIEYVTLYWAEQAVKGNLKAQILVAYLTDHSLRDMAKIALGLVDHPQLPMSTGEMLRLAAQLADEKENQDRYYADKPVAGFFNQAARLPVTLNTLDSYMATNEIYHHMGQDMDTQQASNLGKTLTAVSAQYNIPTCKRHRYWHVSANPERPAYLNWAKGYSVQILYAVPSILEQLGF